ncbi:hypothetical protein HD806DRAFT_429094 [Xylariaceae sp. AK1471]|nr:hypothetical protein HD806DRAFT_429094 [Xylariaceae sp. AK1471]
MVYMAEAGCRHLTTVCRMCNDLGSMVRDANERCLNSLNFPEFVCRCSSKSTDDDDEVRARKAEPLWIAQHYEEHGLETALELLVLELRRDVGGEGLMGHIRFFFDLTMLYGHIYILEDLGTRTLV